jgi:chemotaxis protein MotB
MWHSKYDDSMKLLGTASVGPNPLGPTLTNELTAFAQQNPDLVEFDANRGMVKFKSDVTFAVGDATVTSKAKEVLNRFASILNSGGADGYELMIAGHTDSTPVTNPKTMKLGHFDNWYLSAHRAIAVGHELVADGVNSGRMGVTGYADKRPIASNASEGGKQQNRRVEVLILPTSVHTPAVASADPAPRSRRGAKKEPTAITAGAPMTKDAAPAPAPAVTFTK